MASFSWLGVFRMGDWISLRRFLLQELRNVDKHIDQCTQEINRIGKVIVLWKTDAAGVHATETRRGIAVFPPRSSLDKLMKAYIAQGGNPFDISLFLDPETGVTFEEDEDGNLTMIYNEPYGGLITVKTRQSPMAGTDIGGEIIYGKNPRLRIGKVVYWDRAEIIAEHVTNARSWASQAIREKRQNLEWRIIKLMDLEEQLRQERRDRLISGLANMLEGKPLPQTWAKAYTLQHHIDTLDRILFDVDDENVPIIGTAHPENYREGHYDFLMVDRQDGSEDWTAGTTPWMRLEGENRIEVASDLAAPPVDDDE